MHRNINMPTTTNSFNCYLMQKKKRGGGEEKNKTALHFFLIAPTLFYHLSEQENSLFMYSQ